MEAISRLYNSHKTKKKFKRLWTEYVQLASEPRSELFYDTAVSRMHTLLSIVAIIKSTEPDFSLISDDTAGDAPCHFDVTVYLLTRLGQENLFSCKDEAQSSTLHDTFLRLLVMLDQCICNPRYVERLTPSEENLMNLIQLCGRMKHFNIAEVPLMLDVLSFVCGVKPTRDSIMVVREPVLGTASVFCQRSRVVLLQAVSDTIQLLKNQPIGIGGSVSVGSVWGSPDGDRRACEGIETDIHAKIINKLLKLLTVFIGYTITGSDVDESLAAASSGLKPPLQGDSRPMNSDKACRSCSSRIDNLHDFKHQWQKIEDEDPSLNSAQIIDEGLLDRKKSDIVFHITEVKSMYPTTGNDVQSALMATASDVSDMAFRYRLVDAFVSVLNVIQTMGNSLAVIRVIADFLRRCARSSLCFAILNGHCALVAMLSRSYKEFRQLVIKRDDSQRTSSSYFVSDVFPNKLSPDGYINTTPRHSRDKRTAEIFEKVQVEVHTALVQLICGLSNSYLDTCSCNLDNKDTLLLPLSVDFDILSETQLLSTFSACNLSIHHAQLLLLLTLSGDPLLVQTGAQLCAQLIICNPVNSITIEMAGGVAALVANVKMLLCEVPHLCEGTRETPWLVELGGTTITNNASIKYGFGCTSAKVSTRTQIDHVHAGGFGLHYSKDEIQKSLVFIIRALVVFSAITEIRTSDAILAALMTISHIEVSQALLRGPVGSDQIMFSDTFFEKKYAGQDSSRRYTPVSGALQQPKCYTLIDCQSYSVMCQRCRISKAVSQCTSSICKNNDAHLVCKKCRPPLCIASHLALPIADSEADFPVNWQYVKCKDEPASISVVLEEVFEELMAYPDLMHILLSTYNLANLPVQTPLYYSLDTKYDDDTDVTDVIHKRRMSAFENLFSVQCNTGNILNVFDTETYVQDQWENVVILVAAVKSMCDDKLARGLHIPNFIQVLLLESMKQVFFNPTFISDRPVSTIVERFANLPANAALSSVIFSAKFDCTGSDIEPPNIHQYSLRRILAAILIQCLSRFLTKDRLISIKRTSEFTSNRSVDNYRALRRPDDARRLSDFISLGGPVILVCVIIGSSIVSNDFQLSFEPTLADRQFALWCLRESLVCALSINSGSLAGPISNQLVWLMRSAISPTLNSSEVHSGQNSPIFFSLSSDVADSCITGASFDTPAQCATVPSTIIFLIIQELRILMAGDSLCSDHDLKLMQPMSKILTLSDADEKPTLGMLWSGPFDAVVLKPSLYSVLPNLLQPSSAIGQDALISFGAVEYLLARAFGYGAHPLIADIFGEYLSDNYQSTPKSAFEDSSTKYIPEGTVELYDYDIMLWWSVMGCLRQLVNNQAKAKHAVECCIGIDRLATMLLPVIDCLGECGLSNFLISFLVELCVSNGEMIDEDGMTFVSTAKVAPVQKIKFQDTSKIHLGSMKNSLTLFCMKSKEILSAPQNNVSSSPPKMSGPADGSSFKLVAMQNAHMHFDCSLSRLYLCNHLTTSFVQEVLSPSVSSCTYITFPDSNVDKLEMKCETIERMSDTGSMYSRGRLSSHQDFSNISKGNRKFSRSESFASVVGALSTQSNDLLDESNHSGGDRVSSYQSIQGILSALNMNTISNIPNMSRVASSTSFSELDEFKQTMEAIELTDDMLPSTYNQECRTSLAECFSDTMHHNAALGVSSAMFTCTNAIGRYHELHLLYRMESAGLRVSAEDFFEQSKCYLREAVPDADHIILDIIQTDIMERVQIFGGPEMWRLCLLRALETARLYDGLSDPQSTSDGISSTCNVLVDSPTTLPHPRATAKMHGRLKNLSNNSAIIKLSWDAILNSRNLIRRSSSELLRFIMFRNVFPVLSMQDSFKVPCLVKEDSDIFDVMRNLKSDTSQFYRVHFLSVQTCEVLLSCVLALNNQYSIKLLSMMTHLLRDNPLNADIMIESNIILRLVRLVLLPERNIASMESPVRNHMIQLLAQLLHHSTSAELIDTIIASANQGTNGSRKLSDIADDAMRENCSKQAFYILGRAVERRSPKFFLSFAGGNVFKSAVSLELVPEMLKISSKATAITVSGWVKIPDFKSASTRTVTLLQLIAASNSIDDSSSSHAKQIENGDDFHVDGIDIFFRHMDRETLSEWSFTPESPSRFIKPFDKDTTKRIREANRSSTVVQLCLSFHRRSSRSKTDPETPFFSQGLKDACVRHAVPDVVINFDWSKCNDWSHIALSFSQNDEVGTQPFSRNGILCWIDGINALPSFWTPLGYAPDSAIAPSSFFTLRRPDTKAVREPEPVCLPIPHFTYHFIKSIKVVALGGLSSELDEYERCNRLAEIWGRRYKSNNNKEACNEDYDCITGIELLQGFVSSNIGLTGQVCDFCILAGIPDIAILKDHVALGPIGSTLSTFPDKSSSSASASKQSAYMMHGLQKLAVVQNYDQKQIMASKKLMEPTEDTSRNSRDYKIGSSAYVTYGSISKDPVVLVQRDDRSRSRGDDRSSSVELLSDARVNNNTQLHSTASLVYELLGIFTSQVKPEIRAAPLNLVVEKNITENRRKGVGYFADLDNLYTKINKRYGLLNSSESNSISDDVIGFKTRSVADVLPKLKGLKTFFARLCTERRFQVASVRILVSLMATNSALYQEFLDTQVEKLVLFCMCRRAKSLAPCHTTTEVLQILFDFVVSGTGDFYTETLKTVPNVVLGGVNFGACESIRRIPILGLLIDIACANPTKPKLARCISDWLRSVCEDNMENINKVLHTFGLSPFLIMLSVWSVVNCEILIDGGISPANGDNVVPKSGIRKSRVPKEAIVVGLDESVHEDDPSRQLPKREYYRLQLSTARFLKQLITGSFGEYNGATVSAQATTPTGFSVAHLTRLMHFILRATAGRQKGESSGSGRLGAISPGMLMNRGGGDIQADEDRLIWSTHQRVQQQTTADGCIIPLTWLSHAAQLALEVVIDVIDSPLHSNISHMLKLALPGNDYIYVVLDLMGSSNVSIKIAAINLLSLYLCDTDGQVDLKQIAQFEKVGGFHCMSELLSNFTSESTSGKHYGNNRRGVETSALVVQDLLEALLSLLFWRKRRKYDSSAVSSGAQLQPAMRVSVPPTDVNIAKSGSIQPNLTAYEKNSKLMTMGYGYGKFRRDVDCADELDSVGTSETGTTATTANIGPPGFHRNTSIDIEDDALGDKPQIGHVRSFGGSIGESPLNSEKTHRFTPVSIIAPRDNFSSVDGFNSIGESILQGNNANLLPMFGPSGQLEATDSAKKMTETSDREKSAFSTSRLEPSRELIQIPQVLESILRVLQIANHPSVIKTTFAVLGAALGELEENVAGDNAHAFYDKNSNVLNRNVDAICSQRDWILWLCDMYLTFQRRCRHGTLNDGFDSRENNVTSMSESESSIGGGYDSEDSVELRDVSPTGTSRKTFPRDRGRSLSPTSAFRRGRQESDAEKPKNASNNTFESNFPTVYERSTPIVIPSSATSIYLSTKANMLEAYLEPLFSFAQVVFLHELRSKPQTTRKFNDIINRIPIDNPEARQFQMNLLFDVLDAAAVESFVDPDKSMNVLRNVSTLLEQAAEKVDIEIEFCVRAVDTMDSLSYNCPTVLRAKIKETSLPEMRLLYVTRVLIDTTADIETKAASIRDIHGSIVSMVTSQDGKSLQDAQVVTILLGMWAEAADEIERNTELIEQCNSPTKDMGPTRSRSLENSTLTGFETKGTSLAALESAAAMEAEASLITRQEAIDKVATMTEIQLVTLELLQDIINASQECRKYVYKVFINLEAAVATLEKHKGLISMTSIPNGFHRSDIFLAGICNRYSEDNVTMNDLLSLNLFSGDTMFGEHKAGNEFIASSKESSSPDGTVETTLRNHQSPSGGVIESLHSSQSWWGSWVGSATTTSNPVVSNPTSPLLSMISNNSDDILPLLNLPSVTEDIGTSVFETRSKGASSGGLLFQIVSPGSSIIAVESIANNTVFIGWYSKFSNRELRAEIKNRVSRDLKPILRHSEKIQERVVQRRARSVRSNLEKLTKEKSALLKGANECTEKSYQVKGKFSSSCGRDNEGFLNGLLSRIVIGEGLSWARDNTSSEFDTAKLKNTSASMGVPVGEQQANEESACDAQIKIDVAPVEEAVGHLFLKHLNGFREHRKYTLAAPNSTGDEHLTVFKSIISLDSKFISCEQSSM